MDFARYLLQLSGSPDPVSETGQPTGNLTGSRWVSLSRFSELLCDGLPFRLTHRPRPDALESATPVGLPDEAPHHTLVGAAREEALPTRAPLLDLTAEHHVRSLSWTVSFRR